jgi:hypothetical protein
VRDYAVALATSCAFPARIGLETCS